MSSPPRSLTLEAQRESSPRVANLRRWMKSSFIGPEILEDAVEQHLRAEISQSSDDERTYLLHLLQNYRLFKSARGSRVGDRIFQSWIFEEDLDNGGAQGKVKRFLFDSEANFSAFASTLSEYLLSPCSNGLRLLVLSFDTTADREHKFFTASNKIAATFRGHLRSLPLAPNNVVAFLFAQDLNLPRPSIDAIRGGVLYGRLIHRLQPPSRKEAFSETHRGNLDPNQVKNNYIQLQWQRDPPKFSSDVDVYIWEQHKALPVGPYAEVQYFPKDNRDETNVVIVFRDECSLQSFRGFRDSIPCDRRDVYPTGQIWTCSSEVFLSICAVFQVIVIEMTEFLEGASFELKKMSLLARQSPSTYKIRYLVHMEDCRSSAHQGIEHGLVVLNTVLEWVGTQQTAVPLWDAGRSFQDRAVELQADLEFICDELTKLKDDIADLKHTLYEHQALTHDRRNFILTLLAAVFLPLSFASTFFGMNMNTMTSSGPTGFSNWTTAWILDSPADMQNSTRALASTIGSSGTLTYNWRTYIITAACLVLTLPLSLTIGSILRTAYRGTAYYATYWRAFAVIPILALIFGSVFGSYLSPPGEFLGSCCNVIVILYLLFKIYRSSKNRQRRAFWASPLFITVMCFLISVLTLQPLVMIVPWLYFAFIWLWPIWKRRKQKKAREQNENSNELEMTPISTPPAGQIENVATTANIQRS